MRRPVDVFQQIPLRSPELTASRRAFVICKSKQRLNNDAIEEINKRNWNV